MAGSHRAGGVSVDATQPHPTGKHAAPRQHGRRQAAPKRQTRQGIAIASAATSALVLIGGTIAANTVASTPAPADEPTSTGLIPRIEAAPEATLAPARVEVGTEAAPPPPEPEPVIEQPQAAPEPEPAVVEAPAPVAQALPAPPPPPADISKAQRILSAAMAQLGVYQDCTMLVTNSLATVGIYFHDWPWGYLSLGTQVSAAEAVPGDLLYYAGPAYVAHIAVYAGNGMAVHGGYNGNETRLAPIVTGINGLMSGPTAYIRVS